MRSATGSASSSAIDALTGPPPSGPTHWAWAGGDLKLVRKADGTAAPAAIPGGLRRSTGSLVAAVDTSTVGPGPIETFGHDLSFHDAL